MGAERKSFWWFCIALLLVLVAFYFPWLAGWQSYYLSDSTYYFEPLLNYIGHTIREGHLPLWNPTVFCGMPQIAVSSPGIFYPPNWLIAFMSYSQFLAASMLLHQLIAGVGMYLLVAGMGWGGVSAGIAGAIAAMSGYMFSLPSNYTLVATAAWVPFSIWSIRRVHVGANLENLAAFAVCALSVAMMLGAGRPEVWLPALLLLGAYAVATAYTAFRLDRLGVPAVVGLTWRTAAIVVGILLAMPIILPGSEWASLSPRGHGLKPEYIFVWSANWYDLLCLVLAQPLGDFYQFGNKFLNVGASRPDFIPFLASAYVGPIAATLAIWGACDARWRARWIVLSVLLGSLIMTLGNSTPIPPLIHSVFPFLAVFRYPIKLIVFVVLCLALLAGRGMFCALESRAGRIGEVLTWMIWSLALVTSIILLFTPELSWLVLQFRGQLHDEPVVLKWMEAQPFIGQAGIRASIVGLSVCAMAQFYWSKKLGRAAFSSLTVSALFATLLAPAFMFDRHGTDADFFARPSALRERIVAQHIGSDREPFRIAPLYLDPLNPPEFYKANPNPELNSRFYQYARQLLLPNTHMDFGLASIYGYEAAETATYKDLYTTARNLTLACNSRLAETTARCSDVPLGRFCQMTSTAFAFTQSWRRTSPPQAVAPLNPKFFQLVDDDRDLNVRTYRVLGSLPHVYFPRIWRPVPSQVAASDAILHADTTQFDAAECSLVEESASLPHPPSKPFSDTPPTPTVESPYPEYLRISVSTPSPRLMVITDQFYPGWHCTIDTRPTQIHRVNAVHRGIFVPAGKHTLEFTYIPRSLLLGLLLSVAAILFTTILAIVMNVRTLTAQRRKEPATRRWG